MAFQSKSLSKRANLISHLSKSANSQGLSFGLSGSLSPNSFFCFPKPTSAFPVSGVPEAAAERGQVSL